MDFYITLVFNVDRFLKVDVLNAVFVRQNRQYVFHSQGNFERSQRCVPEVGDGARILGKDSWKG